jgi:hypothetical protein
MIITINNKIKYSVEIFWNWSEQSSFICFQHLR